jgi:gluconolactonase
VSRAVRSSCAATLAALLLSVATLARAAPPATIERLDPQLDALLPRDARVEVYAEGIEWAEGPLWSAADGRLLFSDVPRNGIYAARSGEPPALVVARAGYEGPAPFAGREPGSNGLALDADGRLVYCRHGERDVARREADGRVTVLVARHEGRRLNSPNDLALRSGGDLYFTDPPFGLPGTFADPGKELPYQGVYRLRADGTLELLVRDLEAPNGLAFSPDERTLYVSNAWSARPVWTAYPVDEGGALGPGRPFADARAWVAPGEGVPDGLKVDRRGNVWAAGPGGIHVFAPDGTRLGRIVTGVPTGNVAFGEDGGTLFIAANHRILRLRTLLAGPPAAATARGR